MSYPAPSTSSLQTTERIGQYAVVHQSQPQSLHTTSVHILDDYSLINVFYLYRPFLWGKDYNAFQRDSGQAGENWWYKLVHVCRRWRNLILGSASYLGLCLYCTKGTPIANMLAHSPPLPLVIEYDYENYDISAEDEEGLVLALELRDRIRRIDLRMATSHLRKFIMAIDEEFPLLEYLIICSPDLQTVLMLPETLRAPRLYQLALFGFVPPIRSGLLMTAVGLVTLSLSMIQPYTCFHPNDLLRCLLFTPQLEVLMIDYIFPFPYRDVESQLTRTPIVTPVTLPNLRRLLFNGASLYLEALLHRITTPRLEKLEIRFANQVAFSYPHLLEFMKRTESLSFGRAFFYFSTKKVYVRLCPREKSETYSLSIHIDFPASAFDLQVSSIAIISNALSQALNAVEHLTFIHDVDGQLSQEHSGSGAHHSDWQKLLKSFSNVKSVLIDDGLVEGLCRCLQSVDGGLPLDFLPKLQELTYIGRSDTGVSFTSFINARQNAGRPVTLVRRSPNPSPSESPSEDPTITPARGDVGNETT